MDIYRRIGIVCRAVPAGTVATYGQIALLCGRPQNSRQVGYALRHGLAGAGIPAHRIVSSRGVLSGAAYFETYDLQKMLLANEGVEVIRTAGGWQVDVKRFKWNNTMEDALDFQKEFEEKQI